MAATLLSQWRDEAYSADTDKGTLERLWRDYFEKEKGIYEQLLKDPDKEVKGTVAELAEKYGVSSIPCLIVFDGGEEVDRKAGLQSKKRLLKMLGK